jgi:hypothetical protein
VTAETVKSIINRHDDEFSLLPALNVRNKTALYLRRMFNEQQTEQIGVLQEECPDLEDPSLGEDSSEGRTSSAESDAACEQSADMFLLWETLTDIAQSDNGTLQALECAHKQRSLRD